MLVIDVICVKYVPVALVLRRMHDYTNISQCKSSFEQSDVLLQVWNNSMKAIYKNQAYLQKRPMYISQLTHCVVIITSGTCRLYEINVVSMKTIVPGCIWHRRASFKINSIFCYICEIQTFHVLYHFPVHISTMRINALSLITKCMDDAASLMWKLRG